MTIKRKLFLIVICGFSAMIGTYIMLTHFMYRMTSDSVARQDTVHTFEHAVALLDNDLKHLRLLSDDWGRWDDIYGYILSPEGNFESSNLTPNTFRNIAISHFLLLDVDGKRVFSYPAEPAADAESRLSPYAEEAARLGSANGMVSIDGFASFVSARTVVRSDGSGPPAGVLLMARNAAAESLPTLAKILDSRVSLAVAPFDPEKRFPVLTRGDNGAYRATGPIAVQGRTTELFLTIVPRQQSITVNAAMFVAVILVGIAIAFGVAVIVLLLMDKYLFRRLARIGKELEPAAKTGSHSYRVSVECESDTDDEIAKLGDTLNKTLDALEQSFAERDSLFQEIRHRVKNNLQVVASLLSLQADEAPEKNLADALQNSRRRVLAMSFVHEELYCSDSLNSIDLEDYLGRLSLLVRNSLDPEDRIAFSQNVADLTLSIEKAVPFALIANETLENSYRHAFSEQRFSTGGADAPRVETALREEPEGTYVFTIVDNGCGIDQAEKRPGALGLTLVEALAAQLRARMKYERRPEGGTAFTLWFPAGPAGG